MKEKKYYYITTKDEAEEIQKNGIVANEEGEMCVFMIMDGKFRNVLNIAGYIATNQMFLEDYALFEIKEEGITGKLSESETGGKTAQHQKEIKQDTIDKDKIEFLNFYNTTFSL